MEEPEKINGKKKLPSIPSNFVTLLQLKERWNKEGEGKQKGKEEKEEPQQEQVEKEAKVEERVDEDEVAARRSRRNGDFHRRDRKPKEEKIAVIFAVKESEGVEKEKKAEELKEEKKKKKKWAKGKKNKKEKKARADNEGEEVDEPTVHAPLPASVENNEGEKEMIGDEAHAVKLASVEATRELKPRIRPRTDDRTVEIGRKFGAMSVKGETRRGDHYRYERRYGNFNHFGGNSERHRRYYGGFDSRKREVNQRNEGMVWVKKGEVSGGNVSGIQSSSCSSKELY
ncbi:hypothetical protein PTKIN_Ptkin09bG0149100 [Pterospermum kingtungense]